MPAPATQNPNVKAEESKSKKKKQQAKAAGEAPSTQAAPVEAAEGEKGENPGESSYVKDLKKYVVELDAAHLPTKVDLHSRIHANLSS